MKLHELSYTKGSRKDVTRIGRGTGSGKGKTATRGHKGQNSRSGGGVRPGFEGGQTPLYRRIPKRGFNSLNQIKQKQAVILTLTKIEESNLKEINLQSLINAKIIKDNDATVKILANGELTHKVKVNGPGIKVSNSAKLAIEKVGGTVEVL